MWAAMGGSPNARPITGMLFRNDLEKYLVSPLLLRLSAFYGTLLHVPMLHCYASRT